MAAITLTLHDRDALTDRLRDPIAGAMPSPAPLANRPLDDMTGFISAINRRSR